MTAETTTLPRHYAQIATVARDPERDAYLRQLADDPAYDPDGPRDPRYWDHCAIVLAAGGSVPPGTALYVCLPRERPDPATLPERVAAWLSTPVQWAATLVVEAAGDGWARCRVTERNADLPDLDGGIVAGMRVYLPRRED